MSYPHSHEAEEAEFGRGSRLWDADPEVCCAAFQLGACAHTEALYGVWDDDADPVGEPVEPVGSPVDPVGPPVNLLVDEPF